MQIKRDYSQPFFGTRRRRRSSGRLVFIYVIAMAAALLFVGWQFSRLQLIALDAIGFAPTPTPFASTWADQGYALFLQGKLEQAATAYAQAVQQQPDNINYIYEYGRTLIELDRSPDGTNHPDVELASKLGDHAKDVAPGDVRSYALKAKALVWLDDSKSAIPIALQGVEIDPNFAPLLAVLARAYTDIGRYQQGLKYGEDSIKADPMSVDAHRSYAISLILVGERDAAIQQLEDAININPNLTAPYFELALQFLGAQQYDDAVATYETVLKLDPQNPKALLRLCEAWAQIGQDDQAQGYCEDAITSNPSYGAAYRQLGVVNYHRRNYEDAITNFDKCVSLEPDSPEIQCFYLRGLAHYYLGECADAWSILNTSLSMVPNTDLENPVLQSIQSGLTLVTQNCNAYQNAVLPTLIPPTAIPPTPIGIGG